MSFFSNPLAEEDEVVPPDYPLEQYDERKREDDFNELLVRSTKLEAEQRTTGDTAAAAAAKEQPELVACLRQNQQIRSTLEEKWGEIRDESIRASRQATLSSPPSPEGAASPFPALANLLDSVRAGMQAQERQREALTSRLSSSVNGLAAQLAEGANLAAPSPTASAYTALQTTSAPPTPCRASGLAAATDVNEAGDAVKALEAQLSCMSSEEAALATAAVQHLLYGLRSWTALVERHAVLQQSVAAKVQEQQEAHLAAETVARWAASRQLASDPAVALASSSATASAPLSFDLATAEALNKELNEENWRLEAVLARLLAGQDGARHASLAGSALVQYVGLLDQAREVEQEVHRLGSAVLYLRAALANPSPADAPELVGAAASSSTALVEASHRTAPRESMWAARQAQLSALVATLQESAAPHDHAAAHTADKSADEVLLLGLTKLRELYDGCLKGVALLNTYFEKQTASASLLVHAARGGDPVDGATAQRVLDVPLPAAAVVRESLESVVATCADFAADVRSEVQRAVEASAATLARWDSVRTTLTRLLEETLALLQLDSGGAEELSGMLAAYADPGRRPPDADTAMAACVRVMPSWVATLQEEAEAFRAEKTAQGTRVREYWTTQHAEANKKMTWLKKQPNAQLLLQLCAAEKEKGELQEQIQQLSGASVDASGLQDTLGEVQRQVEAETLHNKQLQEELETLRSSAAQLEQERASLLAFLSQS